MWANSVECFSWIIIDCVCRCTQAPQEHEKDFISAFTSFREVFEFVTVFRFSNSVSFQSFQFSTSHPPVQCNRVENTCWKDSLIDDNHHWWLSLESSSTSSHPRLPSPTYSHRPFPVSETHKMTMILTSTLVLLLTHFLFFFIFPQTHANVISLI